MKIHYYVITYICVVLLSCFTKLFKRRGDVCARYQGAW